MVNLILNQINILAIQGFNDGLPHVNASDNELKTILNIVIGIVTAISILFVVIGGLRYVLSAGDSEAASKARSTIIYAAVGLIIAITAEGIVTFVLSNGTISGL